MVRKVAFLVILLSGFCGATQTTDDFQRPNGSLGPSWTNTLSGPLSINAGGAYGVSDSEADAVWQGSSVGNDQFSEILLRNWDTGWVGTWVRRIGDSQGYLAIY